ncbi:hypothetical protein FIBSPDRAFT_700583, partial [Athelia psychrophila]
NAEDVYAAPDSIITKDRAKLHIANFSPGNVTIQPGQILGTGRNPHTWLDRKEKYSATQKVLMDAHAQMIRKMVEVRGPPERNQAATTARSEAKEIFGDVPAWFVDEDVLSEPPVEGGPKMAEVAEDSVSSAKLFESLDINPDLPPEKRKRIEEVIWNNQRAFGLDDRLGELSNFKVQIPLYPGAKEVSLPPFPSSPAKREAI